MWEIEKDGVGVVDHYSEWVQRRRKVSMEVLAASAKYFLYSHAILLLENIMRNMMENKSRSGDAGAGGRGLPSDKQLVQVHVQL